MNEACHQYNCQKSPNYGSTCYQHTETAGFEADCVDWDYKCQTPLCPCAPSQCTGA